MEEKPIIKKLNRPNRTTPRKPLFEKEHWNRIKTTGEGACFVCDKKFKANSKKILIGSIMGEKLYRHDRCDCNSENWKKKFKGCNLI